MVATAPEIYKKYVTVNRKGELVLYMESLNALYRIMKAALLFYIKFVENLKSNAAFMIPYSTLSASTHRTSSPFLLKITYFLELRGGRDHQFGQFTSKSNSHDVIFILYA